MQVKEVISFQDRKEFLQFPKRHYQSNPDWIAPLDQDIDGVFDPNKNKNFQTGDAKRWLLIGDSGETLGQIAAFYSILPNERKGGIGFFDCIQDSMAAFRLFDTAKKWLVENNCLYMDGPINFGERDKYWGLLVSGFENPSYQENYHYPYYQSLFEAYGFMKIFEQTTSEIDLESFKMERFLKMSERVYKNEAYHFEHYQAKELKKFALDFVHIYNKAWAGRPDFEPITLNRIESTLVSLKPILMEDAIWFVYANGEPAGFYVNVLDVNQIFKHLNGKMNLWAKVKFLYYRQVKKIDRVRGIVFGVIPTYQNLGLETGLIMRMFDSMRSKHPHITRTELSWVGDFNSKMLSLFQALGAKTSKVHYTYRYTF